jgi:hypothetical protein
MHCSARAWGRPSPADPRLVVEGPGPLPPTDPVGDGEGDAGLRPERLRHDLAEDGHPVARIISMTNGTWTRV